MNKIISFLKEKLQIIDEHFTLRYLLSLLCASIELLIFKAIIYTFPAVSLSELRSFVVVLVVMSVFLGIFDVDFPKESLWKKLTKKKGGDEI